MEQQSALALAGGASAFAYALDSAGAGFWELDYGSGRLVTSWQHDRIFGCEQPREWLLPEWHEHIFADDRDHVAIQLAAAKLIGSFATECRIRRRDGELRWVAISGALHIEPATKRRLLAGVIIDITDSRAHEQRKAAPPVGDLADSVFISQMSHEIRTLLHAIQGFNFLLQKSSLTPSQKEYVGKIDTSAHMLLSTLDAIADYSKIEIGTFSFDSIDFRLDHTLDEVCAQLAPSCEAKGVQLTLTIGPNVPLALRGDPRRLRQIVLSLASYALSSMRGGEMTLSVLSLANDALTNNAFSNDNNNKLGNGETTDEQQALLYFSLRDSGTGLNAERAEPAADVFLRNNRHSHARSGANIGLAVSKRLIELMGGNLSVSSELGKGAEFSFSLLFARNVATDDAATTASAKAIADVRILLVDDDVLNLLIGRAVLEHLGVRHIDTATNGLEAVDLIEANGGDYYQLILMDIQMPVLDGYVAAREIRRLPGAERVAIVAMTADMAADSENCIIAGMNELMTKPIRIQQLTGILERRLGVKMAAS